MPEAPCIELSLLICRVQALSFGAGVGSLTTSLSQNLHSAPLKIQPFSQKKACLPLRLFRRVASLRFKEIFEFCRRKRVPRQGSLRGFRFQRENQKELKYEGLFPPSVSEAELKTRLHKRRFANAFASSSVVGFGGALSGIPLPARFEMTVGEVGNAWM